MSLTDKQFLERTQTLLQEEKTHPLCWWYLSFADRKFLGGVVLLARGIMEARLQMPLLGIKSPGGQVMGVPLPDKYVPTEKFRNKLLSRAEVKEMWPDAARLGGA